MHMTTSSFTSESKTTREEAAEIFRHAAHYIRTYGWQKSGMSEHGKPRCSMGALASAHQQEKWNEELAELMYRELYDHLGGITLTEFNERAKGGMDVALLFEEVAGLLQSSAN